MNKFEISIIIPCYNAEKYIEKTINSILQQYNSNIQIILVNDGSTDHTYETLQRIKQENKIRNITILNQKNQGVSVARNLGLEYAEGKYVMFIDSDDWIDEKCLKKMYNIAITYNSDIVKSSYYEINSENRQISKDIFDYKMYEAENLKDIYIMFMNSYKLNTIWGMLIKRDIINNIKFDKNMRMGEDLKFNLEIFCNAKKIITLNDKLYFYYRGNEISVTRTLDIKKLYNELIDTTNVYYSLIEYNKKWNLNYPNKIIMERINEEILKIIKKMYIFPVEKHIRTKILQDYSNFIRDNNINLLLNGEMKSIINCNIKMLDIKYFFKYRIIKKVINKIGIR